MGSNTRQEPSYNNSLKDVPSTAVLQQLQEHNSSQKESADKDSMTINAKYIQNTQNDPNVPFTADKLKLDSSHKLINFTSSMG